MTSTSRRQFEEWASRYGLRTDTVRKVGRLYDDFETQTAADAWSARDSEVERLREALKAMADEFIKVFPIYYYVEPWAHDQNKVLQDARSLLSSQVKESGT